MITKKGYYVLSADFDLVKSATKKKSMRKWPTLTYQRESKQPLEFPSAGSVFKRPPGYYRRKTHSRQWAAR